MSIWVTGSLEVRDSSDRLVLQVGDSSGDSPTKSMSTEVTGSFEVVSNVDTTNYKILTASHNGVAPAVGIGVTSAPNVNFAIGGDLGLTDTASDSRLTVQANTNAYLNVGVDNNNRGFMFWEGNDQRIRFGTKEGGSNYFNSFIIKSGSADVQSNLTVGNDLTVTNNTVTTGLKVRGDSITASDDGTPIQWDTSDNVTIGGTIQVNGNAIKASDGDTPIQWDTNDNVTIAGQITVEGGSVNVDGTSTSTSPSTIKLRTYDTDGIASSDQVGVVEFYGSEDGINNYPMAYILAAADETFVPATNFGSKLVFGTATNGGTLGPKMTLDNAGDLEVEGEIQINGNAILASDGGTPISWDTSDNVTIGGAIQVNGNAIQASDGGIPIQWDTSDNVTIGGSIQVDGDEIKDSGGNVAIELDGSGGTGIANNLAVIGGQILDSSFNSMITLGDDMSIGRPGNGSVSIGVSSDAEDAKVVVSTSASSANKGTNIFRPAPTTYNAGLRDLVMDIGTDTGFVYGARGATTSGKWQGTYQALRVAGATNLTPEAVEYPPSHRGTVFDSTYWQHTGTFTGAGSDSDNTGNSMTSWDRVVISDTSGATAFGMTKDIPCGPTYRIRTAAGKPAVNGPENTDTAVLQYSINGGSSWVNTTNEITPASISSSDLNGFLFSFDVDTSAISTTANGIRFRWYYDPSIPSADKLYFGPMTVREDTASFTYPLVVSGRYPLNGGTQEGRTETTHYFMKFCPAGGNTTLGYISAASSAQDTIIYNTFTGGHEGYIETGETIDDFDILVYDSISPSGTEAIYNCRSSSSAMQKNVVGISGGSLDGGGVAGDITVVALGNFKVKVCNQGGNIEIGDLICTSDVKGAGMKQSDDILRAQTVARASENVDWSQETEATKIIHCTVHCG